MCLYLHLDELKGIIPVMFHLITRLRNQYCIHINCLIGVVIIVNSLVTSANTNRPPFLQVIDILINKGNENRALRYSRYHMVQSRRTLI